MRGLPVEPDDKVVVELVRFPDAAAAGEGVIIEVLGSSKNPAIDTLAVMRQYGLEEEFPDEVIEQARRIADEFAEGEIPEDRRDLTEVGTLTIDPIDARDFDDAISLSRNRVGNWELMVHIADVAHFVPRGTPLGCRGQAAGDERLSSRPGHPDVARTDQQSSGQLAAAQGAFDENGFDGDYRKWHARTPGKCSTRQSITTNA